MPNEAVPFELASREPRRVSTVALVMLGGFLGVVFPYWSGLEIVRPALQVFYACAAPVYLDLAMARWRAPKSGVAAWGMAMIAQVVALAAVRMKVAHWVWPNAMFYLGAAVLGLGFAIGAAYFAEFWSGQTARQTYMFTCVALFLFWRMTPEAVQAPIDALLLPDVMPWTGLLGGATAAGLGWSLYGRERAA